MVHQIHSSLSEGVSEKEFDELDRQVIEAINRWPEYARTANLSREQQTHAATLHGQIASSLCSALPKAKSRSRTRIF